MPRTTDDPKLGRLEMRVSADFLKRLDDWRRKQPDLPTRAEAIRRLIDEALGGRSRKTVKRG